MTEWARYSCEIPTGSRSRASDCAALEDVFHVAHVADARRIIEDGKLKARLVYDESRLNRTRMHVCWVSANSWSSGSIYGTVEFTFKWSDLVKGKQVYWVEAMTDYSPEAYRFLLTDRDPASLAHVLPYDPQTSDGPLRRKGDEWYWNPRFTSEFMIDADLSLTQCVGLNFVTHHRNICRLFKSACRERQQNVWDSGACILGYLIGAGNTTINKALMPDLGLPDGKPSMTMIRGAVDQLWRRLAGRNAKLSGPIKDSANAMRIVQAGMLQYAMGSEEHARSLIALLDSMDTFETALCDLVKAHFCLEDFKLD
jgi:hypothetical protein